MCTRYSQKVKHLTYITDISVVCFQQRWEQSHWKQRTNSVQTGPSLTKIHKVQQAPLTMQMDTSFLVKRLCSIWDYGFFPRNIKRVNWAAREPYWHFGKGAGTAGVCKYHGRQRSAALAIVGSYSKAVGRLSQSMLERAMAAFPGYVQLYCGGCFEHKLWCRNGPRAGENQLPMCKGTEWFYLAAGYQKCHFHCHSVACLRCPAIITVLFHSIRDTFHFFSSSSHMYPLKIARHGSSEEKLSALSNERSFSAPEHTVTEISII